MSIRVREDKENAAVHGGPLGTKRSDNQQAQKRTVLGTVTNVRQQPSRAAKGQFKVFEDKENVSYISQVAPKVFEDVNKAKNRRGLTDSQQIPDKGCAEPQGVESPMVLDESCMETTETGVESDILDRDTILHCMPEYQEEIHDYLRDAELRFRPKINYMRKQTDISSQMRTILIDWLVEVGEEYKLHDETLHLAVNYIDRFLSQMAVMRQKLQLVGTACMYLASKFEEIYPPDANEFVYITDDTYTKKQLIRMEHLVVKVLSFDISVPTANVFIHLFCKQLQASEQIRYMAQYMTELTLLDCDSYLAYLPSMLAASALFLASHLLSGPSLKEIERVTRYAQSEVTSCVTLLLETLRKAPEQPQQAVREKYKSDSRRGVANINIPRSGLI